MPICNFGTHLNLPFITLYIWCPLKYFKLTCVDRWPLILWGCKKSYTREQFPHDVAIHAGTLLVRHTSSRWALQAVRYEWAYTCHLGELINPSTVFIEYAELRKKKLTYTGKMHNLLAKVVTASSHLTTQSSPELRAQCNYILHTKNIKLLFALPVWYRQGLLHSLDTTIGALLYPIVLERSQTLPYESPSPHIRESEHRCRIQTVGWHVPLKHVASTSHKIGGCIAWCDE